MIDLALIFSGIGLAIVLLAILRAASQWGMDNARSVFVLSCRKLYVALIVTSWMSNVVLFIIGWLIKGSKSGHYCQFAIFFLYCGVSVHMYILSVFVGWVKDRMRLSEEDAQNMHFSRRMLVLAFGVVAAVAFAVGALHRSTGPIMFAVVL